ncbi:MAG: hypothetical protein A2W90_19425 [Bacteroidetes bacterium GWF2_42_66]|nr:MAG: hypothetical protein A2W92_18055 [Bacteroidetes bacterium GWA2_42_15]OFX98665.1 MAG: hypothetical protein A2W89_10270 [Bacteroidetes bacterium GWE2_42_39]OFY43137.1 MAG: hypothetical protein A2W90_19425 [Bacteroidetes bacterium GWF2_42_66]HBL77013.1 hypothetical protein [Prolixibacteraceae bacterium]HCR90103.1 hypothetical protein [Prolixibacteraceae bacterium]
MNERIKRFMELQGLSSSELADNIGVQRSNVTHVLKGRNNPSFPFIEKLLKKYPKLNAKWLLMGEGEMMEGKPVLSPGLFDNYSETSEKIPISGKNTTNLKEEDAVVYSVPEKKAETISAPEPEMQLHIRNKEISAQTNVNLDDKTIERVMIFYSDQTFRVYHPSK